MNENFNYNQSNNSKKASTKEDKDKAIIAKHVLELELAYWKDKVSRFTTKKEDWKDSFRNNQLNDTRTITKYAFHFLFFANRIESYFFIS